MASYDFLKRLLGRTQAPPAVARAPFPGVPEAPMPVAPPPRLVERRHTRRVDAREGLRILIIDDSTTIVAVLGKMLRQNHYEVSGAGDAETGIEFARRERPDLIFLDIVLPGISGFDALRQMRRDPITAETPIIMISGNVQATEQFYVRRIGADDFMKKPFGRAEVFARIQQLVEAGRLPPREQANEELPEDDGAIAHPDATSAGPGVAS